MTLKRLFILLTVAECALTACNQVTDLYIHVFNGTGREVEVCSSEGDRCHAIVPGGEMLDFHATNGKADEFYTEWKTVFVFKACGKTMPLVDAIEIKNMSTELYDKKTYNIVVLKDVVEAACR